jgi:Zn-dependent peptidase ImmA (M78 family)
LWDHKFMRIRGAYFFDDVGPTVMLARGLPPDPMVFTMVHELKHHLVDRDAGLSYCDGSNESQPIEIGAEIFAAELIFPEQDFMDQVSQLGVSLGKCTPEDLVQLKRQTRTSLSYAGLAKRAEFLGFSQPGSLACIKWKKLEEKMFGEPLYKRIVRKRKARHQKP